MVEIRKLGDLHYNDGLKERARKLLQEKRHGDDVAFADASAMLERELARYRVAVKRKKYRDVGKV